MEASTSQVKVIFVSDEADLDLPPVKQQLLVPSNIRRYGLSQILNSESMLDTPAPIPFDFLINGEFVRTSLEDYLTANGLSQETTLTLHYVRSLLPPTYTASFQHDDWVSGVDVLSASAPAAKLAGADAVVEKIASSSYDGLVRVWNRSGDVMATSSSGRAGVHAMRCNAVRWLSPGKLASAGLDHKVVVWYYSELQDCVSGTLKPAMDLVGHNKSVSSIDVNPSNRRILTASADGRVGLWSTSKKTAPAVDADAEPAVNGAKRIKLTASAANVSQRGPLALMAPHSQPTTAAIFHPNDVTVAYSASEDHTVRTLDLTTQTEVARLTTLHPILCATALPKKSLVAAGSSARHITILDPRESAATTAAMTLRGHTNMVVSLSPSPLNDFSLVSGSHDSTCKVWDLRSVRSATVEEGGGRASEAVYTVPREWLKEKRPPPVAGDGAKVLSVVWDKTWGIVSAGEDKKVQINEAGQLPPAVKDVNGLGAQD